MPGTWCVLNADSWWETGLYWYLINTYSYTMHVHVSTSSCTLYRVIDVGSEWRTFSNDRGSTDRSRVGAAEVLVSRASRSGGGNVW